MEALFHLKSTLQALPGRLRTRWRRPAPAYSASASELARTRARRRWIGTAMLCVLGVIVLPMVFEGKPRPSSQHLVAPVPAPVPEVAVTGRGQAQDGRYVVQLGPFPDDAQARQVRLQIETLGIKTYAQVLEAQGVRRVRVRVGPFGSKAEADKVAHRLKAAGWSGSVVAL